MAERQLDHEHHFSKLTLWVGKLSEALGIIVGAGVVLLTSVGAFALLWRGEGTAAAKVFLTGVATIAATVGLNRYFDRSNRARATQPGPKPS